MKLNLFFYNHFVIRALFVVLFIYSISSFWYILHWYDTYRQLTKEYQFLKNDNDHMIKDINKLKIKVAGLKESSLDLELLETQGKLILNKQFNDEIVMINK